MNGQQKEPFPPRAMTRDDLDAVMVLENALFPSDPWPRQTYEAELDWNDLSSYWVISQQPPQQPTLLAYGGFLMQMDVAHVMVIGTHPAWQGRGLGTWLLLHMIEVAREKKAQEITLEVRASNQNAQGLYKKLGFEMVGRRRGYYSSDHEDAILMTLSNLSDAAVQHALREQHEQTRARLTQWLSA